MRVLLDTNVLLIVLPSTSVYRPIFDAFLRREYELLISNEVLSEYIEIIEKKTTPRIAENVGELLLTRLNVRKVDVHFHWRLIVKDYDDNKFVDCAVAGRADYLVTNDRHFRVVRESEFPQVNVVSVDEFLAVITA